MSNVKNLLIYKLLSLVKNSSLDFVRSLVQRMRVVIRDHFCEKKLGIETFRVYNLEDDTSLHKDGHVYASTPYGVLEEMLKYIKLNANDVFVDLGCGKGRVIFFVATQKLKKVIGVELRKELVDIARGNLNKLKLKNTPVEIVNADAANFDVKEGTVFFMFNPFGEKTISTILGNIKDSLVDNPRKVHIVYFSPENRALLDSQEWLVPEGEIGNTAVSVWHNNF